jgi:hypothetical protein
MLSIFSTIGLFLTPFLIESKDPNTIIFAAYILAVFLSMFYLSVQWQHKIALYIQFALFHLTYYGYSILSNISTKDETILVYGVLVQHLFVLFLILSEKIDSLATMLPKAESKNEALQWKIEGFIYTNFGAMFLWLQTQNDFIANKLILVLLIIYGFITISLFRKNSKILKAIDSEELKVRLFGIFSAITIFTLALFIDTLKVINSDTKTIIYLIEGTVALYIGFLLKQYRTIITGGLVYVFTIAFIELTRIESLQSIEAVNRVLAVLSIIFLSYILIKNILDKSKANLIDLSAIFIVPQLYIYYVWLEFTYVIDDKYIGKFQSDYVTMISMLLLSILFVKLSKWKYGFVVSSFSLVVMIALGLNIFTTPIHYVAKTDNQFYLYLALQIIMLIVIAGFSLKRIGEFNSKAINGQIKSLIIQLVLFLFINKYFFEFFDQYEIYGEWRYVCHSLILFVFALVSIYISRAKNGKYVSTAGWILLAITLLKLIFMDLAETSIGVRAVLFIAVGLVGIIYSRTFYKNKKNEQNNS